MRNRITAGLVLACALAAAPAATQDLLAGWTCSASEGSGQARLEYDARRRLQVEDSAVTWGTPAGPLRVAFGLPVTGPDRLALAPAELRVLIDTPSGPEPQWLELVADGRPLFAGPLADRDAAMVFSSTVKADAPVVRGAWAAKNLRVRVLDAERRPLGDATFVLPGPDRRAVPLSAAFARARARFGDPKVCTARRQFD